MSISNPNTCPECGGKNVNRRRPTISDHPDSWSRDCRDCYALWGLIAKKDGSRFRYYHSGEEVKALGVSE